MVSVHDPTLQLRIEAPDPWFVEQRIFDCLSSYLQSTSTVSSAEAARSFDALLPSHRGDNPDGSDKEDTGTFLWNAWEAVHKIAQQVPHDNSDAHEQLAKFLRKMPQTSSDPPSAILENWGSAPYALWADLPLFGPTLRELMDRVSPSSAEYRNLNAFLAHLFRDGTVDTGSYAIRPINGAVGYGFDYSKLQKKGRPTISRDFGLDSDSIEVAKLWIETAGEAIWKASQIEKQKGAELNDDAATWHQDDGFFPNRWRFWSERYGALVEMQGRRWCEQSGPSDS